MDELVEEVVRELLLHQPKDPRTFLRQHYAGYPADPSKLTSALGDACPRAGQFLDRGRTPEEIARHGAFAHSSPRSTDISSQVQKRKRVRDEGSGERPAL